MADPVTVCKACDLEVPFPKYLFEHGPLTSSTCPRCGHTQHYGQFVKT